MVLGVREKRPRGSHSSFTKEVAKGKWGDLCGLMNVR